MKNPRVGNKILSFSMLILGGLGLFFIALQYKLITSLTNLYMEFGSSYNLSFALVSLLGLGFIFLIQIICGIVSLRAKSKYSNQALKWGTYLLPVSSIALVFGVPFIIVSVILPIYELTNTIE